MKKQGKFGLKLNAFMAGPTQFPRLVIWLFNTSVSIVDVVFISLNGFVNINPFLVHIDASYLR